MKIRIKPIFNILKGLFKTIKFLLIIAIYLIRIIFRLLNSLTKGITNRLRFSIAFKITLTYTLLFIIIFSFMSLGIILSFYYYMRYNPPEDYVYLLGTVLVIFNLIGLIFLIFFGSKTSRKLLSPVKAMTRTVEDISINDMDKRLDISGSKDELKDLAKTFNDMLDRIQKSVEQQNQFVSDASHELRTPIAVIRGYADLLNRWGKDDRKVLEESVSAIKNEAENMNALIEKLLFLARGDKNTQKVEKQSFLLNEIIDEILRETKIIDTNHQILNDRNDEIMIFADKKLIKEAIRIFVDNSIKFTPAGGTIKLNSYRNDQKVVISIEDTGTGISKEDLPHIFERFYMADKSRTKKISGTGLGLAIAKWIIDNHQGKINVWSQINAGTVVKIELPL
jgi:two-component system sensor histidine kinase ArlS